MAAIAGVTCRAVRVGWPTSTTQVGVLSRSGNGSRSASAEPDRRRQRRRRAGEAQPKARRQPARVAMQVGQAKRFRRPGDVEQQRVRRDDEQDVDEMSAGDHVRT